MKKQDTNRVTSNTVAQKVGMFFNKNASVLACMMLVAIILSGTAFASSADALWSTISNLIQTWVTRLGGVIMFVGGVMFGLGWKSDDAEQKSRGISTIIAGAIIVAIAALTSQFFA
jgi:hypothetical protein